MKWSASWPKPSHWAWGIFGMMCALVVAIGANNVVRDLKLLNTARSDNVQWTLSQSEVEFLKYKIGLELALTSANPDLNSLRRDFDIFYSRIETLRTSSIYEPLRSLPGFADPLSNLKSFLDDAVEIIDTDDSTIVTLLPELLVMTANISDQARLLSNSGLGYFAREADRIRNRVAVTLMQMAGGVAFLIAVLLMLALYLGRLNRLNIRRRRETVEASQRMNIVISTALDAVIVADENGRVLEFNNAAERIFGYSAKKAIGNDLATLIIPDHLISSHKAGIERAQRTGEHKVVGQGRVKMEAKHASGNVFPVEMSLQTANTDSGKVYIAFLRDISHRVRAEAELLATRDRALAGEKAKTNFLATMSHEIRTPLNGLLGNLSLLNDTDLDDDQKRYVKNMDTSGKLLTSHISDVLDITKYDAGKLTLRPIAMNLTQLIQDIIDSQSVAANARNTSLNWLWKGKPVEWINADKERLQHILMNVIGNAVKFTKDGAINVTLKAADKPKTVEISVSDSGIGMDEELQARIFDDFVTGDSSYGRDEGGTGLGLGLALRFTKALGGTITVESKPGAGSLFRVCFPIEPIAAPQSEQIEKPRNEQPSRKILLVEDNEINRIVAGQMLKVAGNEVFEAKNGEEAIKFAQEQSFDLIFMDISMPVLDGRNATRQIRKGDGPSKNTPIVALTANAMAEEQEAYIADGMNAVITKPLSREALLEVIGSLCRVDH